MATTYEKNDVSASECDEVIVCDDLEYQSIEIIVPMLTIGLQCIYVIIRNLKRITKMLQYQSGIETTPVLGDGNEIVTKDLTIGELVSTESTEFTETSAVAPMSLESVFSRYYLLKPNAAWTTTQRRFELIKKTSLPLEFINNTDIAPYGAVRYHALYKSDFDVMVRTDATNFNQGILIIFAVPGEVTVYDQFTNLNYATVMNYPHAFLNIGLENECAFHVPYGHRYNITSINHRTTDISNTLYMMVWSPLVAGTSAPTVLNVSLWLRPVDAYVAVKSLAMISQGGRRVSQRRRGKKVITENQPLGWRDSIAKPVTHAILDNFNLPFGDAIKSIGKYFGVYDRVNIDDVRNESARCADEPIHGINTKFTALEVIPNMAHRFNTTSIGDLCDFARIPSLGHIVSWETVTPADTILEQILISPSSPMLLAGAYGSSNTYYATNCAGIASLFNLYRGSMVVTIQIVATAFHRGTLFIAFDPYGTTTATTSQIYGLPGISMAVGSNNNMLSVRLPYSKHIDYMSPQFVQNYIDNFLGRLYIVVQNALTAPVNVPTTVELLFYVSVGDDAEYKWPMALNDRIALQQQLFRYQSDDGLQSFYSNDKLSPGFILGDHTNLLAYLRRPEYIYSADVNMDTFQDYNANVQGGRFPDYGLHAIVRQLHKYTSGGVYVHWVTNNHRALSAITRMRYDYDTVGDWTTGSYAVDNNDVWNGALHVQTIDPAINFLVPGYGIAPFHYSVPYRAAYEDDPSDAQMFRQNIWYLTANYYTGSVKVNIQQNLGHSVADDFMVYYPMSMFKLAIPLVQEVDGIVPVLPAVGWSVSGNDMTSALNVFARDFTQFALPVTGADNNCGLTVVFPAGNGYRINRCFAYLVAVGDLPAGFEVTLTATVLGTETVLGRFSFDSFNGYNNITTTTAYDSYTVMFYKSVPSALWNFQFKTFQLYQVRLPSLLPTMTASITGGFRITAGSNVSGFEGWKSADGNPLTGWKVASLTNPYLTITCPSPQTVTQAYVTGWPTGNFSSVRISGSNSSTTGYVVLTEATIDLTKSTQITFRNGNSYLYYRIEGVGGTANLAGLTVLQLLIAETVSPRGTGSVVHEDIIVNSIATGSQSELTYQMGEDCFELQAGRRTVTDTIIDGDSTLTGIFSSSLTSLHQMYNTIKDAIKGLARVTYIELSVKSTINVLYKMFKHLYILLEAVISLSTGIFSIVHGNSTISAIGVASIITAIFRYTSSVQQQEELVYEADEGGQWSTFVTFVTAKSSTLGHALRTQFSPNTVLNAASRYFQKMGYGVGVLKSIYNRERLRNPEINTLITAVSSIVKFFIEGNDYAFNADEEYAVRLSHAQNDVERILDNYSFSKKFVFLEWEDTPGNLLPHMRDTISKLRLESALVTKVRETRLTNLTSSVEKLTKKIGKSNLLTTNTEPASILLMGDPGVGKSVMSVYLIPAILNWLLKDHEAYSKHYVNFSEVPYSEHFQRVVHTYTSNENLKYDSLYAGQPMIVVDDAFTERTSQDAAFITRIVNSATMEVPKADVPDKGEVYRSDFVFITTNVKDPIAIASAHINCPEKLIRRFGLMIRMEAVKGATKFHFSQLGNLDNMTMEERFDAVNRLVAEKYIFTRMKYDRLNIVEDGRISFQQILDYLVQRFASNHDYLHDNLDMVAGMTYQVGSLFNWGNLPAMPVSRDDAVEMNEVLLRRDEVVSVLEYADTLSDERKQLILEILAEDPALKSRIKENVHISLSIKEDLGVVERPVGRIWRGFWKELKALATVQNLTHGFVAIGVVTAFAATIYKIVGGLKVVFQNATYENKAIPAKVNHLPAHRLVPQLDDLSQNDKEVISRIRRNVVKISWEGGAIVPCQHALFVNSKVLLVNKHFFKDETRYISEGRRIYITQPSIIDGVDINKQVVAIPVDQRRYFPDTDVVLCTLSVVWPNVRDITKHLVDSRKKYSNKNAVLLHRDEMGDLGVIWNGTVISTSIENDNPINLFQIDYKKHLGVYQTTAKGDCGRPYYIPGVGVVGIHSAIGTDMSYGAATGVPSFSTVKTPEPNYVVTAEPAVNDYWHSDIPLFKQAVVDDRPMSHFVNRTSKLVRINDPLLVEDDECDFLPTAKFPLIYEGNKIDPLITGSQKWDTMKQSGVPMRYIHTCVNYMMGKVKADPSARLLTLDETINGFGDMGPIKLTTSPGVWAKYFRSGKKELFDPLPQEYDGALMLPLKYKFSDKAKHFVIPGYDKSFVALVSEKEEQLKQGLIPPFVFLSTLKDELRSKEKVSKGKTRVFEQSSLDFVLLCRKYFGHFINYYRTHAGFTLYHGIGRDKEAVWHLYATGLKEFSHRGHCFDYKNFDGSLPAECYEFFRLVVENYYSTSTEEERLVRFGLLTAMQNALHIMGDLVFESTQGNKSGNAFTDVFNSISNTFLLWMSHIAHQINHLGVYPTLARFDNDVRMLTYGDDVVMAMKQSAVSAGYDGKFIQDMLSELGVEITSADKLSEIESSMSIEDVTFLKSPFIWDEQFHIWKAPLPIDSIIRELKYRPSTAAVNADDLQERCRNVCRFLAHHSREVFNTWVGKLKERDKYMDLAPYLSESYDAINMDIALKQQGEPKLY